MKRLIEKYKKSLKPIDTEEIFDAFFFRVFSFILLAYPLSKTKISPNILTLFSMISGLMIGISFSRGNYNGLILGVGFLVLTNLFDCADGQLARLTNRSSRFGKTLDGLADFITYTSIFGGLSYYLFVNGYSGWIFLYGFVSMLIMLSHFLYFDHFKNEYITYVHPDYKEKAEKLDELKQRYIELKENGDKRYILAFIYFGAYSVEFFLVSIGYPKEYRGYYSIYNKKKKPKEKIRLAYKNMMKGIVRLWTFFGATTHLVLVIIFALLDRPIYLFHFITFGYTIVLVPLLLMQKKKLRKFYRLLLQNNDEE